MIMCQTNKQMMNYKQQIQMLEYKVFRGNS